MLTITHIGHAGWLWDADGQRVLVDPLLCEDFGRGSGTARMPKVWPPRIFSFEHFPPLDAVVISHEHEDHLNLPSLNLISRGVPIYLSARSSTAAETILKEMGFNVSRLAPGQEIRIGKMELQALSPDHYAHFNMDEWDGLAFVVRDAADGGTFFTNVDVATTDQMVDCVSAKASGMVLTYTGQYLVWCAPSGLREISSSTVLSSGTVGQINRLIALQEGKRLLLTPGESVTISASQVMSFRERMPFVSVPPLSEWGDAPSWRHHPVKAGFLPACGRVELSKKEESELETGLQAFAEFLYGSPLFKALYSQTPESGGRCSPAFLLLLIAGLDRSAYALEYRPTECAFQSVSPNDPFEEYLCGVECWATDLVASFRGDFEPRILSLGHSRWWSHSKAIPDPFVHVIWPFFHPLRWPSECLVRYRAQLSSMPTPKTTIPKH